MSDNASSSEEDIYSEMSEINSDLEEKYLAHTDSEDDDFTQSNKTTIGNVPTEWYDEYPHIGYDVNGVKVLKPATSDELDTFLAAMDNDPTYLAKFRDHVLHEDVVLSAEEVKRWIWGSILARPGSR